MSTSALPGPLRYFTAQLDELRSGDIPDMDRTGRLLMQLAYGHVLGTGTSPYSLILLGDDMLLFDRDEYDHGLVCGGRFRLVIRAARTADPASDEPRAIRSAAARKKGPK